MDFSLFFNDTATTEIYTLSLHDALPISPSSLPTGSAGSNGWPPTGSTWREAAYRAGLGRGRARHGGASARAARGRRARGQDRKSTRLNSSHANLSYAVFWLQTNISVSSG